MCSMSEVPPNRENTSGKLLLFLRNTKLAKKKQCIYYFLNPAKGGKCSNGGIVPNTAFIFKAFVATPWTQSYLCIFSLFYLTLNLNIQVVNSSLLLHNLEFPFKNVFIIIKIYFQFRFLCGLERLAPVRVYAPMRQPGLPFLGRIRHSNELDTQLTTVQVETSTNNQESNM